MDIRKTVERLCRRHQTRDPLQICREKGIVVLFEPLGTVRGYYSCSHRHKVIHINQDLDEQQMRFTCCHELGHALLHPKANTPFLRANTLFSINRLEVEANRFALCMLYPPDFLQREFEGCSLPQLAESLKLPPELAEFLWKEQEKEPHFKRNS
ncbi:MAG: ImmA/IrrE family metallo-endopeptidase [Oscillospiraceae bacterium]|nr:ImmA/IrrE family metallo-endopeptidase [Oscillospiraceae bacterium]